MNAGFRNTQHGLRDIRGFTIVELIMSMLIISILATMGTVYMIDIRNRASDSQAYNEGRNLVTALNDAFLGGEDVFFGDGATEITGEIGKLASDESTPRSAIFSLSSDVRAIVNGKNTDAPGDGEVEVYIWNTRGTPDASATNDDGKKEYYYVLSEITGEVSTPDFK